MLSNKKTPQKTHKPHCRKILEQCCCLSFMFSLKDFFSSQTFTEMNWALLPCCLLTLLLLHTERRKLLIAPVSISNKWVSLSPGHETHLNHCLFLMYMCDYLQDYTWKPGFSFRTFPPGCCAESSHDALRAAEVCSMSAWNQKLLTELSELW